MKKMTYLMMLVLGLTAVNQTQAGMIKNKIKDTKEMVQDVKEADGFVHKVKAVAKAEVKQAQDDTKALKPVAAVL